MGHVTTYVGGVYETYKTFDQDGVVYEVVDEIDQRRSMEFLENMPSLRQPGHLTETCWIASMNLLLLKLFAQHSQVYLMGC